MYLRLFSFICMTFLFGAFKGITGLGDLLEVYEQKIWGNPLVSYDGVGPKEYIEKLPDHVLPMPPLGYIWKRTAEGVLSLHPHMDLPVELQTCLKFYIFSDGQRMGYLNIQNGVTVQGYTDCIPTSFSDSDLRQFYPIKLEEFQCGPLNYWRSHVLDFSTTIVVDKGSPLSTILKENYTPEPYGYWAQTLSAQLVGKIKSSSGGYSRFFLYPPSSKKTQGGVLVPEGVLFSVYADAPHRRFQQIYDIAYGTESFHRINRLSGEGSCREGIGLIPTSPSIIQPIILRQGLSARSALASREIFHSFGVVKEKDPLFLSKTVGLRLRAESEVQEVEGKRLCLLQNLETKDVSESILQYWGKFLGKHAILLDDFYESKNHVIEEGQLKELKDRMVAEGFEDDTLVDILSQVVKNRADVPQRNPDFPDYSLNLSQRSLDISIKEEEKETLIFLPLIKKEQSFDRVVEGGIKKVIDKMDKAVSREEAFDLTWFLYNIITKDRSEICAFLEGKLTEIPALKLNLLWTLEKKPGAKREWNPSKIKGSFDKLKENFPGRFEHSYGR